MSRLLIVEDDEGLAGQYRWGFPGWEVTVTSDRSSGLAAASRLRPAIAIIDLGLPPDSDGVTEGFATLEGLLGLDPSIKVIISTGSGEVAHAMQAIARGAYDFCEKPTEIAVLRTIVDRGARLRALEEENRKLAAQPGPSAIRALVTADETMLKICRTVEKLAATNVPVLLLGESGTGKEALARGLHELGPRAKQPFIAINCGAIPEHLLESELFGHERGAFTGAVRQVIGKIESAHRGTLFLDEIGDLPHPLQVKLLRFLQDQRVERVGGRQPIQVDVRIVSATNQSVDERVADGSFRSDLLYRLNSVTLRIPPLRDRAGDPLLLARTFLARFNREFGRNVRGLDDEAQATLLQYEWPGNVRELENRLKRAVVMTDSRLITAEDLDLAPASAPSPDLDLRAARLRAEREVVQLAIARSNGVLAAAAKLLGISRPTLYGLLETHRLATAARSDVSVLLGADP